MPSRSLPTYHLIGKLKTPMGSGGAKKASHGPWGPGQSGAPTLSSVAKLLRDDHAYQARNVVVLAGAGISTASGIPDFRSPKTGLYANLKRYSLPYPEAIFDIDYFREKPQAFFTLSKELYPGNFKPTLTHCFFKLLEDKAKLLRVFTQNIDTLERLAGLPADRIVEAHGSFATSRCIRCKEEVSQRWIKEKVTAGQVAYCPQESCQRKTGGQGGLVKPDIVFFGEGLPDRFFACLDDLKKADLLIVVGTSLQVQPFASLVDAVHPSCPRILLNLERVGEIASYGSGGAGGLDRFFGGMRGAMNEKGFDFEGWTLPKDKGKEHIRDVFWEGKCDEGVEELARELGWTEDLHRLHRDICRKIDEENGSTELGKQQDESLARAQQEAEKTADEVTSQLEDKRHSDDLAHRLADLDVNDGKGETTEQATVEQVETLKRSGGPSL